MIAAMYWIPYPGALVAIHYAVNITRDLPPIGIIIKCSEPSFGFGEEEFYDVYVDGELLCLSENMIWPIKEDFIYETFA